MSFALRTLFRTSAAFAPRAYHTTPALLAYKDSQDRKSLNPKPMENTLSGRDEDVVHENPEEAFNKSKTPSEERSVADRKQAGQDTDRLDKSGKNQEFSSGVKQDTGSGSEINNVGTSRSGSAPKKGSVKSG